MNMASDPSVLLGMLCCAILSLSAQSLSFPEYSYLSHPLHTLPHFSHISPPSPVIMQKYYRLLDGSRSTSGAYFFPGVATYTLFPSRTPFVESLDALYIDPAPPASNPTVPYLTVRLNGPARVFLLLNGLGVSYTSLRSLTNVTGLDEGWHTPRALQSSTRQGISVGDWDRVDRNLLLPSLAASVETTVNNGSVLTLPHPAAVSVDGKPVSRFTLLFAVPGPVESIPVSFAYPSSPLRVVQPLSGTDLSATPAMPNQQCPDWLHELYVTRSRDGGVAKKEGELPFWRSWHPQIDPIYWCYFGHEHGAYPGRYRPLFGYTAWKTADEATSHGRQDESHAGFKTFAFPLHTQRRYVVMSVHMHLSDSSRFGKRFHTVTFAVLNEWWELEMELQMKGDFGAAQATLKNLTVVAADAHEDGVGRELLSRKVLAFRRFNVLNVDDEYPASVDTQFILNGKVEPSVTNLEQLLRGVYEQWQAPLNTCSWTMNPFNRGFNFDVRNAATGMKRLHTAVGEDNVQKLAGDSINRVLVITPKSGDIEVGIEHCRFDVFGSDAGVSLERSGGIFYTDPCFRVIRKGSGRNTVRQFIKPEFETVRIPMGTIAPTEPWNGYMDYWDGVGDNSRRNSRRFMNIENAVIAKVN